MSRYLEGNFAPVDLEISAYELDVDGAIPTELAGRYVRTGPNPIHPDPANLHWFVGDGMVHGVRLVDGKAVWYRNRYVTSDAVAEYKGIAPVPGPTTGFDVSGNTNVVHHAGKLIALTETTMPIELTPELETVCRTDFGGPLPAGMTAHPKFDPGTGEMHVLAYWFAEPYLRYHVVDPSGRLVRTEEVPVGGPVMVHDMGLTETSVVVLDLPVVFDMELAAAGTRLPYRWRDDYTARVGLMPRTGTGADTQWFEIDPCYVFHPLNAYDDGDDVVIDVVRYETMFNRDVDGPTDSVGRLERWVIDRGAGKVIPSVIDDRPQEFPRADERLATKRHRYGYVMASGLGELGGGAPDSAVVKYDLQAGTSETHVMGAGRTAGEFVFVPAADDAGEDEGFLMGYVHDAATDESDLVILDAHDFTAPPVATIHLPVRVPVGFHGNWMPDRALA